LSNRSDVKLIVTDMDGTLLDSRKGVSLHTLSVLDRMRERNILFSVCTGRIQPMTVAFAATLKLQSPYITANGALIYDPVRQETLWGQPLPEDDMIAIADFCEKNDIDYGVLTMETSYFSPLGKTMSRFSSYNELARRLGLPAMQMAFTDPALHCLKGVKACKLLIYDASLKRLPEAEEFLKTRTGAGYTSSEPGLLDIMCKGIDKGTGIAKLANIMGIPRENVCVFGDYLNDIPMFREAGVSVAMGNAAPEVKSAADLVTRTNDEEGVAWAITELLGLLDEPSAL